MIDTLKLAKRLEAARMDKAQAEALAEGLAESLKEAYVSREYLDAQLAKLSETLTWRIAGVYLFIVGSIIINHFWR